MFVAIMSEPQLFLCLMPFRRDRFRQVRERFGTREKLAALIGMTSTTIANWETTERTPDVNDLSKAAKAMGTTVAYLVEETDDPSPEALLPFTSEEIEEMGFRSRHGSGGLADPKQMQQTHLILLRELAEARRKELELKVRESEHDLKKRGIDPNEITGNT